MSELWLILLVLLNLVISIWNAYIAGVVWQESKAIGGFIRAVIWSAVVMSACGFMSVYAAVLGMVAVAAHWISPEAYKALMSMTYLLIIVPVLGSGLIITVHSWIVAWRERDWLSMGSAAWNTFAQISNTYQAVNGGVSGAWDVVGEFFSSKDDDSKDAGMKLVVGLIFLAAFVMAIGSTYGVWRLGRGSPLATPEAVTKLDGWRRRSSPA